MAIQNPNINTSIQTPEGGPNPTEMALRALLLGIQGGQQSGDRRQATDLAIEEANAARAGKEQTLSNLLAKAPRGASVSAEGLSVSPRDNTMANARLDDRKERTNLKVVHDLTGDYNKLAGQSPARVLAAQAVLAALKDGDISSIGRIKANLPKLEGENYKPTDAERELILQATGEGKLNKLKNFFGMSTPALSEAQKTALESYTKNRLADEQALLDRSKAETMKRYGSSLRNLAPEDAAAVESSLGMGAGELLKQLQGQPALPKQSIEQNLMGGMGGKDNSPQKTLSKEEWIAAGRPKRR